MQTKIYICLFYLSKHSHIYGSFKPASHKPTYKVEFKKFETVAMFLPFLHFTQNKNMAELSILQPPGILIKFELYQVEFLFKFHWSYYSYTFWSICFYTFLKSNMEIICHIFKTWR